MYWLTDVADSRSLNSEIVIVSPLMYGPDRGAYGVIYTIWLSYAKREFGVEPGRRPELSGRAY